MSGRDIAVCTGGLMRIGAEVDPARARGPLRGRVVGARVAEVVAQALAKRLAEAVEDCVPSHGFSGAALRRGKCAARRARARY